MAAVNFARENNPRLVVKGGGYSYLGRSCAPDSLLIWTRRMKAVILNDGFVEATWQEAFWGPNYPRLRAVKEKYDPHGLFFVHHGVGSERWSADGFSRLN